VAAGFTEEQLGPVHSLYTLRLSFVPPDEVDVEEEEEDPPATKYRVLEHVLSVKDSVTRVVKIMFH
jgi:hypothetical protein